MVKMDIIRKVSKPTPVVSPLVIKQEGDKIRICLDPTDLNKSVKRRHYPMKTVEEVAATVRESKWFTKLDCKKGFWQIPVTERTSDYLTFATPWGRYQYLRLPFGISSAPEVFAEIMNKTLEGIENCESAMDDIFIHAKSQAELKKTTEIVIRRLQEAGLTLNLEKCQFNTQRVKFLGHVFTTEGIGADETKIEAIQQIIEPKNPKQVQRFLGMVNYLGKFIPNLSQVTEPLRMLTHKDEKWSWGTEQREAFEEIKRIMTTTPVLKYYDVTEPVTLSVDASSKGLGAGMLQNGQPVAYATRALSPAQQNYPQIEKEAIAIKFACNKFHEYIYGKQLEVETDHKPLETIFKKPLHCAPLRLQKILWDVLQYSPKVKYVKGTQLPIADTLSRDCQAEEVEDEIEYSVNVITSMTEEAKQRFIGSTETDIELQQLKAIVMKGWPADVKDIPEIVKKYANFKEEISFYEGLLFKGHKVIVPKSEVKKILRDVHTGHPGLAKSLERARQSLYWYGQSAEIKGFVERCSVCQQTKRSKTKEPQLQRTVPEYPFQIVSTDLFSFKGEEHLLIADHYSGFVDFRQMKDTSTSAETIERLKEWFSVHGIPEIVESDGGPQFKAKLFTDFANEWGFKHQKSSPYYPKSNGFAERNVQTAKNLLKRCWLDNTDIHLAMLMWRNTPRNEILKSPMERLCSRKSRTILPIATEDLKPKVVEGVTDELKKLRIEQGVYADRISNPMEPLQVGEKVRMQKGHRDWVPAKVVAETEFPRSVVVRTDEGKSYRRNYHHLRRTKSETRTMPPSQLESSQSDGAHRSDNAEIQTTRSMKAGHQNRRSIVHKEEQPENQIKKTKSGRTVKPVQRYQAGQMKNN